MTPCPTCGALPCDQADKTPMEAVDRAYCQKCGGKVEGWICQSCDQEFREDDAGNLVFDDDEPSPDMGAVAWREKVATACHKLLCDELGLHPDEASESAGVFADAILQALAVIPTQGVGQSSGNTGELNTEGKTNDTP